METNKETVANIGLKVEGEGGVIIEGGTDSDSESNHSDSGRVISSAYGASQDLTPAAAASAPVYGSVSVTDSNNVHFGDKHIKIFNGPVSIKQIVQPSEGSFNNSYTKTEDDNIDLNKCKYKDEVSSVQHMKEVKVKLKHMLTFGLVAVLVLVTIFIIVFVTQSKDSINDYTIDKTIDYAKQNANHSKVEGILEILSLPSGLIYCMLLKNHPRMVINDVTNNPKSTNLMTNSLNRNNKGDELLISPHHLRIVSRTEWLAQPVEDPLDKIRQPIPWVIIAHTASESCFIQSACVKAVRLIQTYHIESNHWYDIGYNFLVGGDGSVYVGRGWDYIGAHTKGYNKYSIGIAFIGTFNKESPTKPQVDACRKLITLGVEEGKLAKNYKVFGHRQLMSSLSPGDKVYDIISEWPHFVKNYSANLIPNY